MEIWKYKLLVNYISFKQILHFIVRQMFVWLFEDFFFVFVTSQSVGLFIGIASMDIRKGMTQATIYIMATMLLGMVYDLLYRLQC